MSKAITYETKTCGRCGGSGKYSYCTMYGSTCFGCSGSGKLYTKAGRTAMASVESFIKSLCTVPVSAVVPGMRVRGLCGIKKGAVVQSVAPSESYATYTDAAGNVVKRFYTNINFRGISCGVFADDTICLQPNAEQWPVVFAHAATLKGATVIEVAPKAVQS